MEDNTHSPVPISNAKDTKGQRLEGHKHQYKTMQINRIASHYHPTHWLGPNYVIALAKWRGHAKRRS